MKNRSKQYLVLLFFLMVGLLFFSNCGGNAYLKTNKNSFSPEEYNNLKIAFKKAGKNKIELIKVLEHYQNEPQKFKAALFLIENMPGHCFAKIYLVDKHKKRVKFNVLDYPDYKTMKKALKKLDKEKGGIDFTGECISDLKHIKANFLIENIDYAFKAWKTFPWSKGYSFQDFLDYILPYRGSNEPIEDWRKPLFEKYKGIIKKLKNPEDPVEAASIINDDVRSWFKFDPRFYVHPTDQGYYEMLKTKLGRCEDMTNLTIFALRAMGIAVTSDYTPHWANTGNNHAWNAIVLHNGKAIPFMGAEANPGKYKLSNKLAKAYRKMYREIKTDLYFQKRKQKDIPPWLGGKNYIDVTDLYVDTCDLNYNFKKPVPKKYDIAYISVFNSGEWRVMQWGRVKNNHVVFKKMGKNDILYMPVLYIKKKVKAWGAPFILHNDCSISELIADKENTTTLTLYSTTRRKLVKSTDGITKSAFKDGQEYELFYWDNGNWQSLGKKKAVKDKPLNFNNVPSKALYWLVLVNGDKEERPFTISDDGKQIFW